MSAPAHDGTEPEQQWHRLSPRMLLVHPIIELIRLVPVLAGLFFAGVGGNGGRAHQLIGLLATTAVIMAFGISRWFTTWLSVTDDQVELRSGLLRKRTVATARDRIRTVDVTSHPLHRALGLVRVVVGTGLNDRKDSGRIVLDGLRTADADRLRERLLNRSSSTAAAVAADHVGRLEATELARLDLRWIRYAPFTLSGAVAGLVVWGTYWRIQSDTGVDLARWGPLRDTGHRLEAMPTAVAVLVVLAALIVLGAVTSTVGYVLSFWKFRLERAPGGTLQVRRGLLTTRATSIESRRLVGVTITEPLPLRLVHAARLIAVATGLRTGRGAERGGEVLLPPAPRSDTDRVAAAVLDGPVPVAQRLPGHGRIARRRRGMRAVLPGVVLLAAGLGTWLAGVTGWWLPLAGLVVTAAGLPLAADRYRGLGHAVDERWLVTSTGSIMRRRTVLDTSAVIGWTVRSSPWQRRAGLVTLTATTAAGRQGYRITDVGASAALTLADAAAPGLLTAFARPLADSASVPGVTG